MIALHTRNDFLWRSNHAHTCNIVSCLGRRADASHRDAPVLAQTITGAFVYADDLSWQVNEHLFNPGTEIVRYQQNN